MLFPFDSIPNYFDTTNLLDPSPIFDLNLLFIPFPPLEILHEFLTNDSTYELNIIAPPTKGMITHLASLSLSTNHA